MEKATTNCPNSNLRSFRSNHQAFSNAKEEDCPYFFFPLFIFFWGGGFEKNNQTADSSIQAQIINKYGHYNI